MGLLALTGGQQIGRLSFAEPGSQAPRTQAQFGREELLTRHPTTELFDALVAIYFQSGISGVQPKVLVPDADKAGRLGERTTVVHADLIVKASGLEFPHLTENEFLCMSAARRAGLNVPDFALSADGGLFVVERFDLVNAAPLGFEDMTVLMNRSSREKYQSSYETIAKAIRLYCADADPITQLQQFFDYVVLTVMVRNGDAHLKNFGLLYEHPGNPATVRLAPVYDVVTTSIYDLSGGTAGITKYDRTLALNLAKTKRYPSRPTLIEFGRGVCQVQRPEQVFERIGSAMSETLELQRDRAHPELLGPLQRAWDEGRLSLEPDRVFSGS
jgi:serine/threonine-protein kinase HipA